LSAVLEAVRDETSVLAARVAGEGGGDVSTGSVTLGDGLIEHGLHLLVAHAVSVTRQITTVPCSITRQSFPIHVTPWYSCRSSLAARAGRSNATAASAISASRAIATNNATVGEDALGFAPSPTMSSNERCGPSWGSGLKHHDGHCSVSSVGVMPRTVLL